MGGPPGAPAEVEACRGPDADRLTGGRFASAGLLRVWDPRGWGKIPHKAAEKIFLKCGNLFGRAPSKFMVPARDRYRETNNKENLR